MTVYIPEEDASLTLSVAETARVSLCVNIYFKIQVKVFSQVSF